MVVGRLARAEKTNEIDFTLPASTRPPAKLGIASRQRLLLGTYGSAAAQERHRRLIAEWLTLDNSPNRRQRWSRPAPVGRKYSADIDVLGQLNLEEHDHPSFRLSKETDQRLHGT